MSGRLLLISTPIGNLDDLSPRARDALGRADLLLCEDTRHTQKLLTATGVRAPMMSHHEHNERSRLDEILTRLERGETIGVVSDAGMPLLADPGFPLMREARKRGIVVEPIPGPFAGTLALVASGLPPVPFAFFGFVPHRHHERTRFYDRLAETSMTVIVFETPHRVIASLHDALAAFGDVDMTLAREMTKLHEELIHGTISEVIEKLEQRQAIRGEITLVFDLASVSPEPVTMSTSDLIAELGALRERGLKRTDALKLLAEKHGLNKRDLYRRLLELEE